MRDERRSLERRVSKSIRASPVVERTVESGGESCANGRGRRREKAYENSAHERCMILTHPKKITTRRNRGREGKKKEKTRVGR